MFKILLQTGAVILMLGIIDTGLAHKATERYIPLGQSPGLSGQYTILGTVDTVNLDEQFLSMSNKEGGYHINITDKIRIWLDRSSLKLSNQKGAINDIRPGMQVEVKHINNKPDEPVEWIKVKLSFSQ